MSVPRAAALAVRQPPSRPPFRQVPLVLVTFVLWAYIGSVYVYKTWYIVAAAAVTIVAVLVVIGALRTGGLVRATIPVLAYFLSLLVGLFWAAWPADTLRWVLTDSIHLVVFVLFFLAARNARPALVTSALMTLPFVGATMAVVMYIRDPSSTRLAHYALSLMPLLLPFVWARVRVARGPWQSLAVLTLMVAFGVLVAGRSRTPLAAAVFTTVAAVFVFRRSIASFLRQVSSATAVVALAIGALLLLPATRLMVATTFVRLAQRDVIWKGLYIPAEGIDTSRKSITALSVAMLPRAMPEGIGYMNFLPHHRLATGHEFALHNTYMTWLLEGGLMCAAVSLWLIVVSIHGVRRYVRAAASAEERNFGRACVIALIGVLMMGVFHQVHQMPALWLMFALCAACGAEARDRARRSRPAR